MLTLVALLNLPFFFSQISEPGLFGIAYHECEHLTLFLPFCLPLNHSCHLVVIDWLSVQSTGVREPV